MAETIDTQDTVWLTQEAFDKLTAELAHLEGPGRTEIANKIAAAREEGDLKENGGYHAAREEQGQNEARIQILKDKLQRAKVGESAAKSDTAEPGTLVTVAYDGDTDDTDTFLLGSRDVLGLDDSVDVQVFSPQSPLGAAVVGQKLGAEVSYDAPNGKPIAVTITKLEPWT
ncbi:transcription elongation factor GreA [Parenemella sanctibonifatiensis]|uniref:Transcription elongation factor GreA n=1 Tax=Parenemella sanctibonifatiensis TaxID=2016505 RepID=A0A255EG70_9ACTN|nr:transcription elongation factor GreA [Parenemella sanctibonifatiensis]OYN90529.1 transcription elongation factor GreA [Parenemella sanctibonifatiensis]